MLRRPRALIFSFFGRELRINPLDPGLLNRDYSPAYLHDRKFLQVSLRVKILGRTTLAREHTIMKILRGVFVTRVV